MEKYRSIKVKKYSDVVEEYAANAVITPGMLIELMSTSKVRAQANGNLFCMHMFALEDELQGKGIDSAYAAGDQVQCWIPNRGDVVYALLVDDGQAVTVGDALVSAGNGYLKKSQDVFASYESFDAAANDLSIRPVIGIALDALDFAHAKGSESSAAGTEYPRVRVRIV